MKKKSNKNISFTIKSVDDITKIKNSLLIEIFDSNRIISKFVISDISYNNDNTLSYDMSCISFDKPTEEHLDMILTELTKEMQEYKEI